MRFPTYLTYGSDVVGNPTKISVNTIDCLAVDVQPYLPFWFFK